MPYLKLDIVTELGETLEGCEVDYENIPPDPSVGSVGDIVFEYLAYHDMQDLKQLYIRKEDGTFVPYLDDEKINSGLMQALNSSF